MPSLLIPMKKVEEIENIISVYSIKSLLKEISVFTMILSREAREDGYVGIANKWESVSTQIERVEKSKSVKAVSQ